MVGWPSVLLSGELGELAEDVRRIFQELGQGPGAHAGAAGDCVPPLDVLETDGAIQILMDLPGVPPSSVRVLLKGDVVLIAGEKWAEGAKREPGAFHLVERGSGRFARAVRISGAFDGAKLSAILSGGELRVILPKLGERRGKTFEVPVRSEPADPAAR